MMHPRLGIGGSVGHVRGLADLLEPDASRAGDIAFADTIHIRDLALDDELPPPPSGPVIVNDPDQGTQWMTPFAFPLPPASHDASLATKLRVLAARVRHAVRGALEQWSLWEWERADVVRAGAIGLAVFALAATIGAVALAHDDGSASGGAATGVVRGPRTVEQHTGRVFAARMKAVR